MICSTTTKLGLCLALKRPMTPNDGQRHSPTFTNQAMVRTLLEILRLMSMQGLFIWADNDPLFVQANDILQPLTSVAWEGNDAGLNILEAADRGVRQPPTGKFKRHLITTGIINFFEGDSICYPNKVTDEMEVIGMNSHGHPVSYCIEREGKGRIMVDGGFTKVHFAGMLQNVANTCSSCIPLLGPRLLVLSGIPGTVLYGCWDWITA